ncbi:heparinase [Vibrio aquaticus]|uniref:Heparinase n=1 Tax=Vibrio aquaticus TaxID=2496559 RepID=A0A3S0PM61_9VIBR|nr:heparinase [Vibrio aquaticus]
MISKDKVKTVLKLGVLNLARVAYYQVGLRTGLNPVKRIKAAPILGPLFNQSEGQLSSSGKTDYLFQPFGWKNAVKVDEIQWDKSVLTEGKYEFFSRPWFLLSDFGSTVGDIKGIWEASRFDWAIGLAIEHQKGKSDAVQLLNQTCSDWLDKNPPYMGPNWKCGQEASIRVMHIAFAAKLLGQVEKPTESILMFVKAHLKRIAPTMSYAVAQDNNHGTSEAAALFIGGTWLVHSGDKKAEKWVRLGRKWLENRARHLIEEDGSFSQYSVNYHRVMLDTYTMSELWRREMSVPAFSSLLYSRLKSATNWLYQLTDEISGDAPNMGHNDGARLLPLTDSSYRDFRPSVQLAAKVFCNRAAWQRSGGYDKALQFLGLSKPTESLEKQCSFHFSDGGYFGLRNRSGAFAFVTYPKYRFRPAQCDALHIDLWLNGVNLLRDGGTFSYNAGQEYIDYYSGARSHNTIEFDGRDQMPRVGRFLLGEWLKPNSVQWTPEIMCCQAGYRDYLANQHTRTVTLSETSLLVEDQISGFDTKATLRWRLAPSRWQLIGNQVANGEHTINITCSHEPKSIKLVQGKESRHYYREEDTPVIEVEVTSDCKIITEYIFIQ